MTKTFQCSVISVALASLLGGCALIHSETKAPVAASENWRTQAPDGDAESVLAKDFWLAYADPVLNDLVEQAFKANPDVRIAAANVENYRARVTATSADRFPQVGVGAQAGRGQRGDYPIHTSNVFSVGVNLSWEIDLWGRLSRATDAARADLLAQREVQRGVWLSLASSVAQGYFTLLQLDGQLDISKRTLALRKQSLDLFQLRFDGGVVSEVELSQVRSEYEQAVAAVPQIEAAIARGENALSVLLGRNPGPIARGKALGDLSDPEVPAGLPSQLLARRPDLRSAEAQLAAADARVDAARLAWFPRISLTGLFGAASNDLSSLFESGTTVWNGVAGLTQPIFDAGRIGAGVDSAKATREAVVAQYQKTVQNAFREVDDALVSRVKLREQLAASVRQVQSLTRYSELAHLRYENGYTSYLEVIDADRALFSADLNRIATQGAVLGASVDLYRALGGAWMDQRIAKGG
ncbi:efflux transporter outer membrane subunit [Niveibacterium umoris]|uniref:Multidrug efflux system outer membrane protein n=1 Tax=Niveibacterium umoris TaxID=1193620 RepID=A0A840BV05_9RHOO|nr:efflux transporter outer membrane subunit [Niveibacterium umoris]MBB4014636.1 multidrug efflux system outer membrane protein [Niveibacterium umoris]